MVHTLSHLLLWSFDDSSNLPILEGIFRRLNFSVAFVLLGRHEYGVVALVFERGNRQRQQCSR